MAWNIRGRKTEHAGAKHGNGAFWGPTALAKHASSKERRLNARFAVASALGEMEPTDGTLTGLRVDGQRRASKTGVVLGVTMIDDTSRRPGTSLRRNTRRWCRGKVGRMHEFVLRETLGQIFGLAPLHVWACTRCGRKA